MDPGDEMVSLPRDEGQHLTRVLRLGVGDTVAVFDGRGHEFLARVASAAGAAGKRVGVCGEIATRPEIALALTALGVDSLSVVPTAIPELKQALAGARLEPMRRAIAGTLALSESSAVASSLLEAYSA